MLCGWALLERDGATPPKWLDGGRAPAELILAQHADRASLVAVEWLARGLFDRRRHDALMATARVEGGLAWALSRGSVPWMTLSAGQWRSDVVGRASPSDAEIETMLRRRVVGIPTPPKISKAVLVHALDALGVAYAAAYRPGKQVALPMRRIREAR